MNVPPDPTPTDEYDRVCAERRGRVCERVTALVTISVFLDITAVGILCGGLETGRDRAGVFAGVALFAALWLGSLGAASWSAWLSIWNRDVLPRRWIVLGLTPGGVLLAVLTFPFALMLFGV